MSDYYQYYYVIGNGESLFKKGSALIRYRQKVNTRQLKKKGQGYSVSKNQVPQIKLNNEIE